MFRKWCWSLLLIVATVGAACTPHGERITVEAGAFTIEREQHSYGNWNTGGTTTYYSVVVRYRKHEFQFPGRTYYGSSDGQATDMSSSQIHYAYVVSHSPAALLVVAGDVNNDASWYLLVDTPSGFRAEHVAFYASYGQLAWLDGDAPLPIANRRELLKIEGGRWLLVSRQSILDLDSLQLYRLPSIDGSKDGALFIAFSPDRKKMARFDSYIDANNFRVWHPVILENDIASGEVRSFDIDRRTMWFDNSGDIDRAWLESYFEWRRENNAGFTLQPLANPAPRPYHGRLEVETDTKAVQYHVPRLGYKHRQAAMDFIAEVVGCTYAIEELELNTQEPTAVTAANGHAELRTDAALPPTMGPLAAINLDVEGKRLTVYFSESGLAIENHDPALSQVVRKIAARLDAQFALPTGQAWIADESLGR